MVEQFLAKHDLTAKRISDGRVGWPGINGALGWADIDLLIAREDPVAWAALKMVVAKGIPNPDGTWFCSPGDPVRLLPVQAQMARDKGNFLYESGSEIGKTLVLTVKVLHASDTAAGGGSIVIVGDSDLTIQPIWTSLVYQLEQNPTIGGGVAEGPNGPMMRVKPYRWMRLNNGVEIEARLVGHDGSQLRGAHASLLLVADEMAKAKNPQQWNEFWRAAMPGCEIHIYSTPDGDYASPYFAICSTAVSVDNRETAVRDASENIVSEEASKFRFRKRNIRKMDLPAPFWTETRSREFEQQYGGKDSLGWQTNVMGGWGSPQYSVFPGTYIYPCAARYIEEYRMVRAIVDRKADRIFLTASRLSREASTVEGGTREEIVSKEEPPLSGDFARRIASLFPSIHDWKEPVIVSGADVGSAIDPTELVFARLIDGEVRQIFRLHLKSAKWSEQKDIFIHLDHASGHLCHYGIDNGSAGSALVQELTRSAVPCPVEGCGRTLYLEERIHPFGFGESNDLLDMNTGEPILNPDKRDPKGNLIPFRFSNKESSTRYLERVMQAIHWFIGNDDGAGDSKLAQVQLLMNHTSMGLNGKGERKFKAIADHLPDAWRQLILTVVYALRGSGIVFADGENVVFIGSRSDNMEGVQDVSIGRSASLLPRSSMSNLLAGF